MAYRLRQWPGSVYPKEANDIPDAGAEIDAALRALMKRGPSLDEFGAKCLGKSQDGLWQLGFRAQKKQIRVLYAPYKDCIVLYRIHPKTSPQEQRRAYEVAKRQKKEAERIMQQGGSVDGLGNVTLH